MIRTLQNAIKGGNIHHAYLFTGPRGTGKTSTARLLAKALNCESGLTGEPCNICSMCVSITEGSAMDVVELDAASEAGVDDVRERIVDVVQYKPVIGRYKVFIIDEVHDLSSKAFDALLKTIEEPPSHIIFILATTELHKVPATIQSRCQKFQFNRGGILDLIQRLEHVLGQEGYEFEPAAVQTLARMADGGFRDALSLLEQALLTSNGKLTLQHVLDQLGLIRDEVVDDVLIAIAEQDAPGILSRVDGIYRSGRDAKSILEAMLTRLAELTRAGYGIEIGSATDAPQEAGMKATAAKLGNVKILSLRTMIASSLTEVRDVSLPKLWLESMLLEAAMGTQQAAPAPQPQIAYEAPRTQAVQASPDRAAVVAERRAAEPGPKPPTATPIKAVPPSSDPETTAASEIWQKVLDAITTMSRAASAKLAKTRIKECKNKTLFIAFQRVTDLETFQNSPKLMAAVQTEWTKAQSGTDFKLEFVQDDDQPQFISPMDEAVDLPAGGAKLAEIAKEVFEGF